MKPRPPLDPTGPLVIDLLEAAVRTEHEGQGNIAKLLRASACALARQAGAIRGFPRDTHQLASDLSTLSGRLRAATVESAICDRVALAADVISRGGFADLRRFPDMHVCRRCGSLTDAVPTSSCSRCGAHALTFQHQGPVYWSREWRSHEVVDRLAKNPALFSNAVQGIPPDRHTWTPSGTLWTVVDVLRHIREADGLLAERVALILAEEDPRLEARATYASSRQDPEEPARSILETYRASRNATVRRLRPITREDWLRTGRHAAVGRVTLVEQASFFAAHELTHLRQLEELRRALDGCAPHTR